jgi:putative DNA primase/helicase
VLFRSGWPTKPKAGCCDVLLDLLRYLCSGEGNSDELYQWMLCWLAYPIQHPGAKMQSAVVVHGPQGTGKSRFFEAYAKIFGEYSVILNQGAIEDKFNADWSERKLFVLADEIVANSEKYHLKNQLKNFITSDWVRINPKNVAAHKERNHMNMVFLSNEMQPVVLENDDRRHCVIWTPAKLGDDFYLDVTKEIDNGGIEALHQYLLDVELADFKPWTRPPMTTAKRRLILSCSSSEERFINEWQRGWFDFPFCPIEYRTLMAEYINWCRRENEPFGRSGNQLCQYIRKIGWYEGETKRQIDINTPTTKTWRCVIPTEAAMAEAAQRGDIDYRQKPGDSKARWLAECHFAVELALSDRASANRHAA